MELVLVHCRNIVLVGYFERRVDLRVNGVNRGLALGWRLIVLCGLLKVREISLAYSVGTDCYLGIVAVVLRSIHSNENELFLLADL
jgi:hypothetical protein